MNQNNLLNDSAKNIETTDNTIPPITTENPGLDIKTQSDGEQEKNKITQPPIIDINSKKESKTVIEVPSQVNSQSPEAGSFLHQPPPWLVWITVIVALSTFFHRIWAYFRQRGLSIHDEFWFRQILLPVCIEPLIKLVEDSMIKLRGIKDEGEEKKKLYDNYLKEFQRGKNSVISKFMVLASNNSQLYTDVSSKIDDIEDIITIHCALSSTPLDAALVENKEFANEDIVEQHVYSNLKSILNLLEDEHNRRYKW